MARSRSELSLLFSDASGRPVVFGIPLGTTTIGSARDNDVVLEDPSVKPHQVVLIRDGDALNLRDLFAGETRVNDEVRRNGPLRPGDVLRLGDVRLRVMKVAPRTGKLPRRTTRRLRTKRPVTEPRIPAPTRTTRKPPALSLEPQSLPPPPPEPAPPPAADPAELTALKLQLAELRGELSAAKNDTAEVKLELNEAREREGRRARALARARQLTDEMMPQDDFELILEQIAMAFLTIFSADRAVTVLFEEDGRNPLLTVERRQDGTDEGTGVAQEIIDRCLQVRSVIRVSGGYADLGGLAAPLLTEGRALGLLYFERNTGGLALGAEDVHLMAIMTAQASLKIAPLLD